MLNPGLGELPADHRRRTIPKILAAATLAFALPAVVWHGIFRLDEFLRPYGFMARGRRAGVVIGISVMLVGFAAPFVGYALLRRPFAKWEDFDRGALLLVVALSVAYWTIYGSALLLGAAGVLYGLQE